MEEREEASGAVAVDPSRIDAIVEFVQAAEQLKDTLRSGRTASGRAESTAEHSWRLCLLVLVFERELAGYDMARLLALCIVHDLGEAISGDVPAVEQHMHPSRAERERADLVSLCSALPGDVAERMVLLWDDYAEGRSAEAKLVKGFDKLETMMQHLVGRNDDDFDYGFNLTYGRMHTDRHPLLRELRGLVDSRTRGRLGQASP